MSIFESLSQQLGPQAIEAISRKIGTDPEATAQAVPPALGSLMSALAGNAASQDGDGQVMDDVAKLGGGLLSSFFGKKS